MKKLFIFLLAVAAGAGTISAEVHSGTCGDNLSWSLNTNDSTLIISGSENANLYMKDYSNVYDPKQNKEYSPWYSWNSYIKYIVLPDNLCKIGSFAFYGCSKVAIITIPISCGHIGVGAFASCWGLRAVHIKDLNNWCKIYFPLYMSFGNPDRLYEGTNPLYYAGHLYLNGVPVTEVKGSVGKSMSGNVDLISVEIPNGETYIEAYAFYRCTNLEVVELPQTITEIGDMAFYDCYSLTTVKIPDNAYVDGGYRGMVFSMVPNVEYHGNDGYAPWGARCLNGYIDNYIVYSDAEKSNLVVCSQAAKGHIAISDKVTSFPSAAFNYCKGITSIDIPQSVIDVPNTAFKGCTNLADVYWNVKRAHDYPRGATPFYYTNDGEFDIRSNIKSFTFGENVAYIPSYLCVGMNNLEMVTIKGKIDTIASGEFSGCTNIKRVNILDLESWCSINFIGDQSNPLYFFGSLWINDNEIKELVIPSTVTKIKPNVFCRGASFQSIIIPNGIDSIKKRAFYGCTGVTTIEIPNSVKYIGDEAFADVPNISVNSDLKNSPNAPWGAKSLNGYIEGYVVYNNSSKTDLLACATSAAGVIDVPGTVKTIASYAFEDCTGLTSVKLPSGLESIGKNAFYNVPNIEYNGDLTDKKNWGARSLNGYIEDNLIYANSSKELFLACPSSANGKVTIPSTVDSIGYNAFKSCRDISNLFLKSHTSPQLGDYALSGLSGSIIINTYNKDIDKYLQNASWNKYNIQSAFSITEPAQFSTSANIMIVCDACDKNDIVSCGIVDGEEFAGNIVDFVSLEPDSEYKDLSFYLYTIDEEYDTLYYSFRTSVLTLTTKPSKPVSEKVAILLAETNMADIEVSCGFEWKPNNAPDDYPATKVYCPVANGVMTGRLKNLNNTQFYKYRAFYQSAKGNMYYGDWQYIYTGDVAVEFDPVLYTYEAVAVTESAATLKGYAIAGAEDFTEQGFEYWADSRVPQSENAPARMLDALGEHKIVQATGIKMQVTLTDLDAGTVYKYRTYAKVGDQVCYGAEMTFTTQGEYEEEEGIDLIPATLNTTSRKILYNGQILILRGDKVYTITGQEVR